jgi:mono/diheme cytochrome c family protein
MARIRFGLRRGSLFAEYGHGSKRPTLMKRTGLARGRARGWLRAPDEQTNEIEQKRQKTLMKKLLVCAVAVLVAGGISVRAADAKESYAKDCAKCHGEDGKGKTKMGEKLGIKDLADAKVQGAKDEEIAKAIKEGVKEGDKTKMKGFGETMSDDDIKAMVAYVRTFKK